MKTSPFYQKWFDHGIVLVSQLLNTEGQLLRCDEFLSKFQFPVSPEEYALVFDAVPRPYCTSSEAQESLTRTRSAVPSSLTD